MSSPLTTSMRVLIAMWLMSDPALTSRPEGPSSRPLWETTTLAWDPWRQNPRQRLMYKYLMGNMIPESRSEGQWSLRERSRVGEEALSWLLPWATGCLSQKTIHKALWNVARQCSEGWEGDIYLWFLTPIGQKFASRGINFPASQACACDWCWACSPRYPRPTFLEKLKGGRWEVHGVVWSAIMYLHKAGQSLYQLIAGAGAGIRDKQGQEDLKWCLEVSIIISLAETHVTKHQVGLMVVHQARRVVYQAVRIILKGNRNMQETCRVCVCVYMCVWAHVCVAERLGQLQTSFKAHLPCAWKPN